MIHIFLITTPLLIDGSILLVDIIGTMEIINQKGIIRYLNIIFKLKNTFPYKNLIQWVGVRIYEAKLFKIMGILMFIATGGINYFEFVMVKI